MSHNTESLCELYRRAVRECIRDYNLPPDVEPDQHFKRYLQSTYAEYAAELESLRRDNGSQAGILATRNGLFVLAAGLFAYGDLDAAQDVLTNLPATGGIRKLALALPALLPLPAHLDLRHDVEPVISWLRQNRDRLRWSTTDGAYVFRDPSVGD